MKRFSLSFFLPILGSLLISLVLSFFIIELIFRVFFPQENLYLYEVKDHLLVNRPSFSDLHAMQPRISFRRLQKFVHAPMPPENPGYVTWVQTNSQGLRAPDDYTPEKKNKGLRILALGDSITFGWPFPVEKSYPALLQNKLPESQVINCSVIGANTLHLEKLYLEKCSKFQVDLVLVQVTLSMGRSIPDYFWSDFLGIDGRIRDAVWSQQEQSFDSNLSEEQQQKLISETYRPRLFFYENFHLLRFIENSFLVKTIQHAPSVLAVQDNGEAQVISDLKNGIHPSLQALQRLKKAANDNHSRFLVVIIPNRFGRRTMEARPDLALILKKLSESEIPVLDLSKELSSPEQDGSYLPDDAHPNEKGYNWIADRLKEKILSF